VRRETDKPHSGAARAATLRRPGSNGTESAYEQGMSEYLVLLITTALVNNVVLAKFLGLCPFMGVSKRLDSALGMGLATGFVIVLAAAVSWILETWLLAPLGLSYLRIMTFILVIAATVQFVELVVRKMAPDLYQMLGIYLPLITTNCAVLGLPLINVQEGHSFVKAVVYDFGSSVGFTLALVMFAGLRERLALARVPKAFAGAPIAFVLASLMSLAFMGFSGLNFK
jgi:H+/Na+-translocating ferredoxin:NAD+ oxidoreductase subunit A